MLADLTDQRLLLALSGGLRDAEGDFGRAQRTVVGRVPLGEKVQVIGNNPSSRGFHARLTAQQ